MKKKTIAILLAAVTAAMLLAGCGNTQQETSETEESQTQETTEDTTAADTKVSAEDAKSYKEICENIDFANSNISISLSYEDAFIASYTRLNGGDYFGMDVTDVDNSQRVIALYEGLDSDTITDYVMLQADAGTQYYYKATGSRSEVGEDELIADGVSESIDSYTPTDFSYTSCSYDDEDPTYVNISATCKMAGDDLKAGIKYDTTEGCITQVTVKGFYDGGVPANVSIRFWGDENPYDDIVPADADWEDDHTYSLEEVNGIAATNFTTIFTDIATYFGMN